MAPLPAQLPPTASTVAEANATTSPTATATAPEDADTSMPDATVQDPPPTSPNPKKRKRKDRPLEKQAHIRHQSTFRKPTWSYLHLVLLTPGTASLPPTSVPTSTSTSTDHTTTTSLSPLLASTLLTAPLRAYLGTTGTAIPIDMLKISGRGIWLRIPRQDARGFRASLSGWVGTCEGDEIPGVEQGTGRVGVAWRVMGEGGVLGGLSAGDGMDLFG